MSPYKTAAITSTPEEHQQRVLDRIRDNPGLVVAHGLGSGKTLSSILAMDEVSQKMREVGKKAKIKVITPASLQENFKKEIRKHTDDGLSGDPDLEIKSLNKATRDGIEDSDLLVVDEAHRARNPKSQYYDQLRGAIASKKMLLSGTPVYNHPSDIAPLINLASGDNLLPDDQKEFSNRFVQSRKVYPKGLGGLFYRMRGGTPGTEHRLNVKNPVLRKSVKDWVDFHETDSDSKDFPTKIVEEIRAPLGDGQHKAYQYMMDQLPPLLRYKVKKNLAPNKQEAAKLIFFLNGPRQIANSEHGFSADVDPLEAAKNSPKIQALMDTVKNDPNKKRVIYSNFLGSGLLPIQKSLEAEGIEYGLFTGKEKHKDREEAVRRFNRGDISNLLVSSAGGEGLDLKGTREVHVLEPHWNEQKLDQVIGRAARFGSHADLPEDERNVTIKRYLLDTPKRGFLATPINNIRSFVGLKKIKVPSAEEYIYQRSKDKQKLNDQMTDLMRETTNEFSKTGFRMPKIPKSRLKSIKIVPSLDQVQTVFLDSAKHGQDVYEVFKEEYDKKKDPIKRLTSKLIKNRMNTSIDIRTRQSPLPELREIIYT